MTEKITKTEAHECANKLSQYCKQFITCDDCEFFRTDDDPCIFRENIPEAWEINKPKAEQPKGLFATELDDDLINIMSKWYRKAYDNDCTPQEAVDKFNLLRDLALLKVLIDSSTED